MTIVSSSLQWAQMPSELSGTYTNTGPVLNESSYLGSESWENCFSEYIQYLVNNDLTHSVSSITAFKEGRGGLRSDYYSNLMSITSNTLSSALNQAHAGQASEKVLKLPDIPIIDLPMKRRVTQPRFKIDYDTVKDFNLRLNNSIIHVGQLPYYVREILQAKDDIILVVEDEKKAKGKIKYKSTEAIDLRTPEPQYLMLDSWTVRLTRPPARQQVQGLHSQNSFITRVGSAPGMGEMYHWENPYELLWALKEGQNVIQWDHETVNIMLKYRALKTLRLSSNLAVLREGNDILVEYKGRRLGELHDRFIHCDELDASQPWIRKDVQEVNLSLKA